MAAPMIDGSSAFSDPRSDSRDYPLPPPEDRGTALPWPGVLDAFAQAEDHSASVVVVTGFDTRGRVDGDAGGQGRLFEDAGRGGGDRSQPLAPGYPAGGALRPWRRGGLGDP